jgi:hypothetical protein
MKTKSTKVHARARSILSPHQRTERQAAEHRMGRGDRPVHLDPDVISRENQRRFAEAERRPETYRGPQMTFHRKPNEGGGECEVCGCPGLRVGVLHRALGFGETGVRARYVKRASGPGGDVVETHLDANGKVV